MESEQKNKTFQCFLQQTSCQIPEDWNSRTIWLVLWRQASFTDDSSLTLQKQQTNSVTSAIMPLEKGSVRLKCFFWRWQTEECFGFSIPARWDERRSRVRQRRVGQHDLLPRLEGRHPHVRTAGAAESIAEVTLPHGTDRLVFVPRWAEGETERKKSTHTSTGRFRHVRLLLFPTTLLLQLLGKTAGATQTHHRWQFRTFALRLLLKIED